MTTTDAAAKEPAEAAPAPQEPVVEAVEVVAPAEPEVAASSGDPEPAKEPAKDAPKKRGRKRKVSLAEEKPAADGDAVGTSAEVPAEKSPKDKTPVVKKPRGKAATPATPPKRKVGRPRKIPKEESETEDEIEMVLSKRVGALPDEVKAKFGSIVWAKMVGFPFWPALITDPRLLPAKYQAGALKEVDTKYYVCFYHSNDFSRVLYKNIEAWDDTKHDYRTGHPAKDAKAPKRRSHLMSAIELADKDVPLAAEDRMNGLMKAKGEEEESVPEQAPVVPKRKPGRPLGSKNKPKVPVVPVDSQSPAPAPKGRRGRKKSTDAEEGTDVGEKPAPETPEEDESATPLSKDEIKAKVAIRKTPSKKKSLTPEEKSAAAAVKKVVKVSTKVEVVPKGEIDSKRKKEIELVVPRKSVKSADIREATEEAAQKKAGPREKPKDKGDYKVGNLTQYAGKINRLFANESSKNNDELIILLTQLFQERTVYRTDMERSGVAAVIAALRKSTNPTVAQTASAVRKHLINVLVNDGQDESSKKKKADGAPDAKSAKKQKTVDAPATSTPETNGHGEVNGSSPSSAEVPKSEVAKDEPKEETAPKADESQSDSKQTPLVAEETPTSAPAEEVEKPEQTVPASPVPVVEDLVQSLAPKPDPSGDKARMVCIDMLKKALLPIGERSVEIAREIEAQVYERFSESVDEYRACARSITFGLKKNEKVRERLKNGDLHALELAYSHEDILGA